MKESEWVLHSVFNENTILLFWLCNQSFPVLSMGEERQAWGFQVEQSRCGLSNSWESRLRLLRGCGIQDTFLWVFFQGCQKLSFLTHLSLTHLSLWNALPVALTCQWEGCLSLGTVLKMWLTTNDNKFQTGVVPQLFVEPDFGCVCVCVWYLFLAFLFTLMLPFLS